VAARPSSVPPPTGSVRDLHVASDAAIQASKIAGGGGGGSDAYFPYSQVAPSATWVVTHNLNKRPSVTVVDSGGNVVEGDVFHNSANQLTISFTVAFSGTAYLN
jgi:hypothetical protein